MSKVHYKIESKHSKSNDWVSAWSTEFATPEAAIEVLLEYLANRTNSGINDSHYQILKVTSEPILSTENVVKKKMNELA